MELIDQDGLPKDCYQFQFTLSNKCRPDCAVFLMNYVKRPAWMAATNFKSTAMLYCRYYSQLP